VKRAQLRLNVLMVVFFLLALVGMALLFPCFYTVLKDFASLFATIAAAYLAYCFQRRQAFLSSLRDLWHKIIAVKGELVQYTLNPSPTQQTFGDTHESISTAIDVVRATYRNVGESKDSHGLYPFEPLKDMRRALVGLGFENVTPEKQKEARDKIIQAWNAFRWSFLREFSAPEPTFPITDHDARDPRR